ncbi:MAG TPA: hypothetical protein DIW47_02145 [Bacteroidetes bacterium]|nr:hypothetical protein [Bacteroidota bacterium]
MRNVHPPTANTKRRTILFFEIGMILALSFMLWAFNYSSITYIPVPDTYEEPRSEPEIEQLGEILIEPDNLLVSTETQTDNDQIEIVPDNTAIPDPVPAVIPTPSILPNLDGTIMIDKGPQTDPGSSDNSIVLGASKMPEFPGGEEAMLAYIINELVYPPLAIENGIQGKVMVTFVIEKDGSLSNIAILSKRVGWGIEDEAIRVVKTMPRWSPGENNFRPVRVRINLPIKFVFR